MSAEIITCIVILAATAAVIAFMWRQEKGLCPHCPSTLPRKAVYCPRCGRDAAGKRAAPREGTWSPVLTPAPPPPNLRVGTVMRGPKGQIAIYTPGTINPTDTWATL